MSDYVVKYIKTALTQPTIEQPNKALLNGYGERPEIWEALVSIADAHKIGGATAVTTAWRETLSKTIPDIADVVSRPRRLLHGSELENMPPTRWLIPDEIPEESTVIVFGPSGVGKSFKVLNDAERVGQHKPVAYIMGEGKSGYKARHKAWLKFHKRKDEKLYFYEDAVLFTNQTEYEAFMDEVRDIKPAMVIIDTFAQCFDGEENSSRDVGSFMRTCNRMKQELHCAVVIIHHTTKAGGTERGSGAMRGAADVMIEISDDEGMMKVACSKMKDSADFPTYYMKKVEIPVDNGVTSCVVIASDRLAFAKDELTQNQRQIIQWLASDVFDKGARSSDLKNATGLSQGSFFGALNSLSKRHLIRKEAKYDPWVLTPDGAALARKMGYFNSLKAA
jgi:KaiC/GvpD/RAD55 family RecA-like ATPase